MANKMSYLTKIRLKLWTSLISLSAALTSLCYVTYAWFQYNRSQNIDFLSVQIEQGLSYSLKYFALNGDEGYPAPNFASGDVDINVTNYGTQFLPVSSNFHEVAVALKQPKYRVTYAIEVYAQDISVPQTIDVSLASFVAPPSTYFIDATTGEAISLAPAINIYAIAIDGDQSNAAKTTLASTFVQAVAPSADKFDGSGGPKSLASASVISATGTQSRIFLFTIEFSGDPSTFYAYDHQADSLAYYTKSTSGNSNVYQGLSFTIDSIVISKS